VAAAAAPLVLREDLRVWTPADSAHPGPWYVMLLPGPGGRASVRALTGASRPVHVQPAQGGELLRIYRFGPEDSAWYREHWLSEQADREGRRRVLVWLRQDPELFSQVVRTFARDRDGALVALRPLFPPELHADLEAALRFTLAGSSEGDF
jgi:hypothetical protein